MKVNTFFLRVTARCNLDCDYCYVFKHRDTTWKSYNPVMTENTVIKFCERVKEYAQIEKLTNITIIFHGGEPLYAGTDKLISFVNIIEHHLKNIVQVDFSLQTNGTLLNEQFVSECNSKNIGFSLSVDGHTEVHDKHRKYKNGNGSHCDVVKGINLLNRYPNIFQGVISVIDPLLNPRDIFEFYSRNNLLNTNNIEVTKLCVL